MCNNKLNIMTLKRLKAFLVYRVFDTIRVFCIYGFQSLLVSYLLTFTYLQLDSAMLFFLLKLQPL